MIAERTRLETLHGYGVLDTPNEPEFDRIVREAAAMADTPIALISLVDERRQWFKAKVGIDAVETPRTISFCTHAIRGSGVFEVRNTTGDPYFSSNPLVTGEPHIRFYAGAPLRTPSGARIGTLCVIDKRTRAGLSHAQRQHLIALADQVVAAFETRRLARGGIRPDGGEGLPRAGAP